MNKFSVFFVFISAFFFAGCSDLLNTQKNNTTTAKITSTEVFEISSTTVDISKKVQPNSKVWVVQYNSGKDGLVESVESTLKNSSVVLDNTFSHSESRASFDFQTENPVVFEVPSFVRNYKSNLKPQTELASLKPVF